VFADSRGNDPYNQVNTNVLGELAAAVAVQNPAFVLFPGDLVNVGSAEAFQEWTNVLAPLYEAGIRVFPTLGNHDLPDVPAFTNLFGPSLPTNGPPGEIGTTFTVSYSNALVVMLNAFAPGNDLRINQAWLDSVLATNTLPHVFALSHLPAFKLRHTDCLGSFPADRNRFWATLRQAGCRLYFAGHDHFYDHARVDDDDGDPNNDLHQVIVGTAGGPLYPDDLYNGDNGPYLPRRVYHETQYGFVIVEVGAEVVRALWHHRTAPGRYEPTDEILVYSLHPPPVLYLDSNSDGLTLRWSGSATLQAGPELNGVFTNVPGVTSPYVVPKTGSARLFYRLALE
jgi:hypothetical protein